METMKSILKIIVGLIVILLGAYVTLNWISAVWLVIKAGIALGLLLVGLAFFVIGISDLKRD